MGPNSNPGMQPTPTPVTLTNGSRNWAIYPVAMFTLLIGLALGYFLFNTLPGNKAATSTQQVKNSTPTNEVMLPADAVKIQACSDHRGVLYARPADIPIGPVYMVNKGQVIGVEFMLAKDDFLNGKSYKDLAGLGAKVDHVNIGLLSQGHEGYAVPHYHVDFYMVPRSVEESITCPSTANTASPSASTYTASSSATPSPAKK